MRTYLLQSNCFPNFWKIEAQLSPLGLGENLFSVSKLTNGLRTNTDRFITLLDPLNS